MPSPHLDRKLKEVLGEDAGRELGEVTDRIDPIRGDIAELRHAMQMGFATQQAAFDSMRLQLRYVIVALAVHLAAIAGLYGIVLTWSR